jgi:hypothetical protein
MKFHFHYQPPIQALVLSYRFLQFYPSLVSLLGDEKRFFSKELLFVHRCFVAWQLFNAQKKIVMWLKDGNGQNIDRNN